MKTSVTTVANDPPSPDLLAHLRVRNHPAMPVPLNAGERPAEEGDVLDIRAVGIGSLRSQMVPLLSRNLAGIDCNEIIHDVERESSGDMDALVSTVRSCDLVFILSDFDNEFCETVAQTVGRASCGVLTLVVAPPTGMAPEHSPMRCRTEVV